MQRIRNSFLRFGTYEIIAFATGFALMAFELLASRILAPSIGSSTYIWTSVIGVMIAALALGYAVGGWLADKRVAVTDVAALLLLSAIAAAGALVSYDSVLALVTSLFVDARWAAVVAALVLFMPTSFLLGTISPYIARLKVKSVNTAGRSVAGLSALNSLGGILGTFVTGFVMFSFIGSRESLGLIVVVLLACSWLVVPQKQRNKRVAATAILCAVVALELAPPARAIDTTHIDTPSSHYKVVRGMYGGAEVIALVMGPTGVQSGVYANGSRELVFPYARHIADVIAAAPQKDRVLVLGGGAFTLPEHLARSYPTAQIDVVEIDPELERIAQKHFGYIPPVNVKVYAQDARAFVRAAAHQYNVIVIDVYNEQAVPFSLGTQEFAAELAAALSKDGVVVANIIGGLKPSCAPLLTGLHNSYKSAFTYGVLIPVSEPAMQRRQNIIGIYSAQQMSWLRQPHARNQLPTLAAPILTDNFAPVEALVQQCQ